MSVWRGLMRGAKALMEGRAPVRYLAGGVKVVCPHCQEDSFHEGKALRNTAGMTFIGLDWADSSATTLACHRCGLIQWFAKTPVRIEPKPRPMTDDSWADH